MNVSLWIMQGLLALHTAVGAAWKLSNSEQRVESLQALPHAVWLGLCVVELACAVGLLMPAVRKSLGLLVPLAAGAIAAEMVLFSSVHLASGVTEHGELVYWGVVAGLCALLAYGRSALKPITA
jgi:DNA-binding transcriptional ArsR family regulator